MLIFGGIANNLREACAGATTNLSLTGLFIACQIDYSGCRQRGQTAAGEGNLHGTLFIPSLCALRAFVAGYLFPNPPPAYSPNRPQAALHLVYTESTAVPGGDAEWRSRR